MEQMIKAVREHALKNYENGGWDVVVESYEDHEIQEIIEDAGAKTAKEAIKAVGTTVEYIHEGLVDIMATVF